MIVQLEPNGYCTITTCWQSPVAVGGRRGLSWLNSTMSLLIKPHAETTINFLVKVIQFTSYMLNFDVRTLWCCEGMRRCHYISGASDAKARKISSKATASLSMTR